MTENGKRRRFNGAVKARVAIEALREQKTAAQIASEFECHTSQVAKWKKEAIEGLPTLFATRGGERSEERVMTGLYEQIGRLKMELEWFKKSLELPRDARVSWVEREGLVSVTRQCELVGLNRSSLYCVPVVRSR